MAAASKAIDAAFSEKPVLKASIYEAIQKQPGLNGLFNSISKYVTELRAAAGHDADQPQAKKRKMNGTDGDGNSQTLPHRSGEKLNGAETGSMSQNWPSVPVVETSFSVPLRKKLLLQISPSSDEGIRALNPSSKDMEFGIPWRDIDHILCLPVAEKAQPTYNFCVFPKSIEGFGPDGYIYEPMVWTIPDVKPKEAGGEKINYKQLMIDAVKSAKMAVQEPDASEFVSEVVQGNRKGEKAYHVKAFRGSKDGYLFFLPTGIAWVFKKPLHFFPFSAIAAISYTSVLQRTFNLNISSQFPFPVANPNASYEFSMIDQADFAGIDTYVKRHKLQDSSLAEERKAKKANVNGVKKEKGAKVEDEGDEEESELRKAAREAEALEAEKEGKEDDSDEEEDENFDPGSEGESEGSGTSDEEESGHGGGDGDEEEGEEYGSDDELAE